MPRLGDRPDHYAIRRDFSPDRRIALDWLPFPDPRSQWEVETPEAVELRDAETGAVLAKFGYFTMILDQEWPAEGGARFTLPGERVLRIAPDLATFTADDAPACPIAELPDWLRSLIPPPPPPPSPPTWWERAMPWAGLALLLAVVAFGLSRVAPVRELVDWATGTAEPERGTGGITGWTVQCPDIGWVTMHLQADGRLRVPDRIAPAPLPPIGTTGRRFGDGRVTVEVDGLDAAWWPDGPAGAAVRCPTTIAGR